MASKTVLDGLAADWEESCAIRRAARETGQLVRWPSPEVVGLATMILC